MKRATAIDGSCVYCSKNIHCSMRACSNLSAGTSAVPSPKYQRIALDSASAVPSSSTTTGTLPFGFRRRNSGVRVSAFRMSISRQAYDRPVMSSTILTLWQLPEVRVP